MDKKKFFLVEDDAIILFGLRATFSANGMEVETSNGTEEESEILSKIKKFDPDYIILDLMLPKADGLELLSAINADEGTANIPVFIFSNVNDSDTKDQCQKLGAKQYFNKGDYSIDEFVEKVGGIILNYDKMNKHL
jgi:DNA-binding response OmpR family regulator